VIVVRIDRATASYKGKSVEWKSPQLRSLPDCTNFSSCETRPRPDSVGSPNSKESHRFFQLESVRGAGRPLNAGDNSDIMRTTSPSCECCAFDSVVATDGEKNE
jgi:hypothetical protein